MYNRIFFIFYLLLPAFASVFTTTARAQSASATWALISDTTAVVAGNITASPQLLSDTMSVKDFDGSTFIGAAEKIWRSNLDWPNDASENNERYIQYSVTPTSGNDLAVQSITLNIGCSGTGEHFSANIYYSTDSTFASRARLNLDPLLLPDIRSIPMTSLSSNPGITIVNGQTFYLRVYPWYHSTPSPSKYVCLTDVVISGITSVPGVPTLSVFPDSLSFGNVITGASKEMTYVLSGTNLVPESDTITVAAPPGFSVSASGESGYSSSIKIAYTTGTLSDTTVGVKFTPSSVAEYNGTITHDGGGSTTHSVKVTGTGVSPGTMLGIYVSPNGVDNNNTLGSFEFPFKTITKAVSVAHPGDTIFVRGGRYMLNAKIGISKIGTSINRYYLFAYPGERPVLDFSSMPFSSSNRGMELSGSYWHIKGLDIYRAGDNGMNISGSNNIIEFCAFYENQDTGLQLGNGASNNRIINCDSYYNYDSLSSAQGGNADGFSPKLDVGTGNYFYGCRSWQNSDDGWDGYLRGADNVTTTLENCWCFNNGYLKNGSQSGGNGNGFKMGGGDKDSTQTISNADSLQHNMILINCLAFDNRVKGFDQNNNRGSMTLYNCSAYQNSPNYGMGYTVKSGKTITVTNCISVGPLGSIWVNAIQQTNSWLYPFTVTAEDFISLDTTGVRGPRKADGSLPDVNFMHLAAGSDLIDGGTNVELPYIGSAPDLGCFEYDNATGIVGENSLAISGFQLVQNYPNPFNPTTIIRYQIPNSNHVMLKVYNIVGVEVRTLVDEMKSSGSYRAVFDGNGLASGVYFVRLTSGSFLKTIRIILVK